MKKIFTEKSQMKGITIFESLEIQNKNKRCILDGKKYALKAGAWTCYVPKIQTK